MIFKPLRFAYLLLRGQESKYKPSTTRQNIQNVRMSKVPYDIPNTVPDNFV